MKYSHNFPVGGVFLLLSCAAAMSLAAPSLAASQEQSRSVSARVVGSAGAGVGIRAEKEPGYFTVPEGHVATGFRYEFHDPSTNYTSQRLSGSSIYSRTQKRYVSEVAGNPDVRLPAGEYTFVVGGSPGASGTLGFKIVPTTAEPKPGDPATDKLGSSRNFDASFSPRTDLYVIDKEGRKRWCDFPGVDDAWVVPDQVVVRFRDGQVSAQWEINHTSSYSRMRCAIEMAGTFADGRFSGTEKTISSVHHTGDNVPPPYQMGTVWSLSGQVDSGGLLVIEHRWQSDFGQVPEHVSYANGRHTWRLKPHESHGDTKAIQVEIQLRLPVGIHGSHATGTRSQPAGSPSPSGSPSGGPVERDIAGEPGGTLWDTPSEDTLREPPSGPPVIVDQRPEVNDIWDTKDDPPDARETSERTRSPESPANPRQGDQEDPPTGGQLPDGKIMYKPPWDEGDAYPMDEQEVQAIREKERQGYRWDKRHGWVNDDRQKEIDDIADIERRNDELERTRARETFQELADSQERADKHAEQAKRAGDMALMQKVKALGWQALTDDEREQLGKADDDVKNHLRGKPENIRGYERGVVDNTLSQGAIDTTHAVLQGTKTAIDEGINFLETKTGLPGKAIGKAYTITSNMAESASQAHADYHSGKTDRLDYDRAITEGFKKGVTSVIVDEISGELNKHVTDRLLDNKAGKRAADYIEGQADQARKQAVRDFLSGKSDSLNARVLDDAAEKAADAAKQTVEYAVGRATKPAYDATLTQPVQDAVDWSVGGKESKQRAKRQPAEESNASEE